MSISLKNLSIDAKYNDGFAIVTGGNEGIGLSTVKMLREHGIKVLVIDQRVCLAKPEFENDADVIIEQMNIKDTDQVKAAIERAEAKFGKVRLLINSAGVGEANLIQNQDEDVIIDIIDVNLKSLILISKFVGNKMKEEEFGTILNISSGNAFQWLDGAATYTATKQALVSWSELYRREMWTHNIRVGVIYPGLTDTGIFRPEDKSYKNAGPVIAKMKEVSELQSPDEIARTIEFQLLLPQSSTIRGIFVAPTKSNQNKVI